jgi:hypothetical protein
MTTTNMLLYFLLIIPQVFFRFNIMYKTFKNLAPNLRKQFSSNTT